MTRVARRTASVRLQSVCCAFTSELMICGGCRFKTRDDIVSFRINIFRFDRRDLLEGSLLSNGECVSMYERCSHFPAYLIMPVRLQELYILIFFSHSACVWKLAQNVSLSVSQRFVAFYIYFRDEHERLPPAAQFQLIARLMKLNNLLTYVSVETIQHPLIFSSRVNTSDTHAIDLNCK
jgi:hypothetical protein